MDSQHIGGILDIPNNWFVYHADFDDKEPYIIICDSETFSKEVRLPVPKSLAYYLTTHFCGSEKMNNSIVESAKLSLQNQIKALLGIE